MVRHESGYQRVGPLSLAPALLGAFGHDVGPILKGLGLPAGALDDPDGGIPFTAACAFMAECARASGRPHFGLIVGDIVSLDNLGLVGTVVRNAPTLGEMIGDLIANHHRYVEGALFYVMPMGNEFLVGYAVYQPGTRGAPEFVDAVVAASVAVLRDLGLPSPLEVLLSRDEPADPAAYHAHFPMPVRFATEMSGIVLPRDALAEPTPGADPATRAAAEAEVESYFAAGTPDILSRLRRAFFPDIMFGAVTQEGAASRLGLTARAMNRQLKEAGTSFRDELERTRFELARQLLANTSLPVPQISSAIGYSGPGVFARTFRRWTGATPLEWRESNRPQPLAT